MELRAFRSCSRKAQQRRTLGDITNVAAASSSAEPLSAKHRSGLKAKAKPNLLLATDEISGGIEGSSIGSSNLWRRDGVPSTSVAKARKTTSNSADAHTEKLDVLPNSKKRKNKRPACEDVLQASCPPAQRVRITEHDQKMAHEYDGHVGAHSVPYSKPKKRCRQGQVGLPKDFIEKQKAYFAEIDAFELPEEEVSEADLE